MDTWTKKLLIVVTLAAMCSAQGFANQSKSPRDEVLQQLFEQINHSYFTGGLEHVEVRWANLKTEDARAVTRFYDPGSFVIEVDRALNGTPRDARKAIEHEACHVATLPQLQHQSTDVHGPAFHDCMRRFSIKSRAGNELLAAFAAR